MPSNSGSTSISTSPTAAALLKEWSSVQAVDHHCHPLRRWPLTLSALELRASFTEAADAEISRGHVINTASYQGALRRLAAQFGCDPDEETVMKHRNRAEPTTLARRLLEGTATMLVDTGFASEDSFTLDQQASALAIRQHEIVRLETLAETQVAVADNAHDWLSAVRKRLEQALDHGAVGVKTICAYRTSLNLTKPDGQELTHAFDALKKRVASSGTPRLTGNVLCHTLLLDAARVCLQHDVPLQVHCGFGDPDEDLAEASPLGLRPLFVDEAYHGLNVALLHCYPYHREAAYLCSVFPGVYMDLSLAIPFAARDGQRAVSEALGLCPTSKLLYASDASRYPEVFFVAAGLHREALADALAELIDQDFFTVADAIHAGKDVLAENARRLYRLG